jgi:gliding motility-associated-like protein
MRTFTLLLTVAFTLLFKVTFSQIASCPPNLDFEAGNLSNWQCQIGSTSSNGIQNNITLVPSPPLAGRHEIISATSLPAMDPYGGFPKLCPYGGNYSVKLGNTNTGSEAEGMSYSFIVPPTVDTFTFTYFYAIVLEDPGHPISDQPRFFVTAYEVATGNIINCASYNYVSSSSLPGFLPAPNNSGVLYRDWSPTSLQFAGLGGKEVRLEFKTADCTQGGHFGYAYFDVASGCSNILASAPYCIETNSLLLNAPYGFASYTWYDDNFTQVIGNQQNITLSPPPAVAGIFHVDCIPYPGFGCRDTFNAIVTPLPVPDTPKGPIYYKFCQNDPGIALQATALPGNLLLWYNSPTGGTGSSTTPIPSTTANGISYYYVSQKVLFGCEGFRKKITVEVLPKPIVNFSVNTPRQCLNNNNYTFTSNSTNLSKPVYTWDFGDNNKLITKSDTAVHHQYTNAGSYTVTLSIINDSSCTKSLSKNITLIPKPVAAFIFPDIICQNQTSVIVTDQSAVPNGLSSINNWWWSFGGIFFQGQQPAAFVPAQAGKLPVKLVVKTNEGCLSDTLTHVIPVHYQPKTAFKISQLLCENETIQFTDASALHSAATGESIIAWSWIIDNSITFNNANPYLRLPTGNHSTKFQVQTNYGCKSIALDSFFTVNPKPLISLSINDSCVYRNIKYQVSDSRNITANWYWDMGNGLINGAPVITTKYNKKTFIPLVVIGTSNKGCKDTVNRPFIIYDNIAIAGRDTTTAMWEPVQLNAKGYTNTTYLWSPAIGLNTPTIEKPLATWDKDQLYTLYSVTKEGCDKTSKILIKRYKGPDLYIPTAFTPNGDNKNDVLHVLAVGIKSFGRFTIYDRWGRVVFNTTDATKGWDGILKGQKADSGTYVAVAEAVDYHGSPMIKKEMVILIR